MAGKKQPLETEIKISGEAEYKAACRDISKSLSVVSSEMKLLSAEYAGNEKSVEALRARQDALKKQFDEQKRAVEANKQMLALLKDEGKEGTEAWKLYEAKLNQSKAALQQTKNALGETKGALAETTPAWQRGAEMIGNFAKAAGQAAVEAGKAMIAVGKSAFDMGMKVVDSFGELEQNLGGAEAVFGDHADKLIKTSESAYKTMGMAQSDQLAYANKIGALFQGAGIEQERALDLTTSAMQRAADMASVMGIDTKSAMDAVTGAAKGNYTMMDNLGVAMNDTTLKAYAAAAGMEEMWTKGSQADKAEIAMKYFFEQTSQYAGNFEKESRQTIAGSMGMLKSSVASFVAGLGNADADVGQLARNITDSFRAVMGNVSPVFKQLAVVLPEAIRAILPDVIAILPELIETASTLFHDLLAAVVELLPEIIPVAIEAILMIVQAFIDNLTLFIEAGVQIIVGLIEGLTTAIPTLVEALPQIIEALVTFFVSALPQIITAGIQLLTALITALPEIIEAIVAALPQIIDAIVNGFIDNVEAITLAGVQLFIALITALPDIIVTIVGAIPEIVQAIVSAFKERWPDIVETGKNIIEGLWEGIKSMGSWIGDKVSGFFGGIIDSAKEKLGIASPSKVFAGIGTQMAEGVGVGFDDEIDTIQREIAEEIRRLAPKPPKYPTDYGIDGGGVSVRPQQLKEGARSIQIAQITITVQGGRDAESDGRAAARGLVEELRAIGVSV